MPSLLTQRDLQIVRNPGFCYLCGKKFSEAEMPNRDHVPPDAVFNKAHRSPPLVLLTHPKCNWGEKDYDEQIGQVVSLLHGVNLTPRNINKLRVGFHRVPGSNVLASTIAAFPFQRIVNR